jgi:hypothetical protein
MTTIISGHSADVELNAASVADDQRTDARHRTVLQVAKLVTESGDELCILRNVSAGGLRAEVYSDLAIGDPVQLELRTGRCMGGQVVWTSGPSIGVEFDRKVPILSYLAHQAMQELGRRVRPPRVRIGEPGILRVAEGDSLTDIVDASQAGMRVRSDRRLSAGAACQVVAEGLGARGALVRWCRDGQIGLQLKQPLSFREFGQWRTRVKSLRTCPN